MTVFVQVNTNIGAKLKPCWWRSDSPKVDKAEVGQPQGYFSKFLEQNFFQMDFVDFQPHFLFFFFKYGIFQLNLSYYFTFWLLGDKGDYLAWLMLSV